MASDDKLIIELAFQRSKNKDAEKKFLSDAKKLGKESGAKFSKGFKDSSKGGFASLAKGLKGPLVGALLLHKGVQLLSKSMREGVEAAREFSRGIAEINTILPRNKKLTQESIDILNEFASEFGTNPTRQARAFYSVVSAGVKGTAKQLKTLELANKAAVAGLVDINSSTLALVSSVNSYAATGLTAEQVSDTLFATVREGLTTFGELSQNIGTVAPVAASVGLKFGELAGTIAAVTKAGINTPKAITGIRQVLVSLVAPSREAKDLAKALKLEFSAAALKAKGFAKFLKSVKDATGGSSSKLAVLFGNVRALTPILQLVGGDFEDFERILKEVQNSAGDTGEAFKIMSESADFKLKKNVAELLRVKTALGNLLLPILVKTGTAFTTWAKKVSGTETPMEKYRRQIRDAKDDIVFFNKVLSGSKGFGNFSSQIIQTRKNLKLTSEELLVFKERLKSLENAREFELALDGQLIKKKIQLNATEAEANRLKRSGLAISSETGRNQIQLFKKESQLRQDIISLERQLRIEKRKTNKEDTTQIKNRDEFIKRLNSDSKRELKNLIDSEAIKKDVLQKSFDDKLILETEFASKKKALETSTDESIRKLFESQQVLAAMTAENVLGVYDKLSISLGTSLKQMQAQTKAVSNSIRGALVSGIAAGITTVVDNLMKGENAFAGFAAAIGMIMGDLAIQLGKTFIATGLAIDATKGLAGGQAVAAGIGLIAVGAILKNLSGGSGASSAATSNGGSGSGALGSPTIDDSSIAESEEVQRAEAATNVSVVVNGDVFDSEETGGRIATLLSDAFGKQGVVVTDGRFA